MPTNTHSANRLARWLPLILIGTLLAAMPSLGEEWTVEQWEQTVYYRHTFNAAEAASGLLRLTAVDEYEVFLNGELVGSDGDWATMEEYPVDVQRRRNELAVQVANRGLGNGSGLVLELSAGEQVWASTFGTLQDLWYWSGEPQEGTDWLSANVSRLEAWQPVQRGQRRLDLRRRQQLRDGRDAVALQLRGAHRAGGEAA